MTLNKQLINLLGILVVVGILIAGIALIAVPMVGQAQTTASQTATVEQTNAVYEAQIAQLTAAQADQAQLDADTAALRAEIPASTQFDDVFEIAINAAVTHQLTIQSVTMAEPAPWVPRTSVADDGTAAPAEPAPATDAPAEDAAGEGTADAAGDAGTGAAAPAADPASTPRQQAVATITVPAPDFEAATAFVDSLQDGLRLLNPVNFEYTGGILTVTVNTFIRTDG
ncbi:hypothetical protein N3K63_15120 [Microbacterium sp. W1N]|uniref:hypothetical protein n=1 Tax=Microbacterium festucae TaxID=2977531 RepID=UPI0021BF2292|nr:hypothetical protein [Microbacterium festucae]MCT9821616.1 hypothetical protein [Microbacterium festucae]